MSGIPIHTASPINSRRPSGVTPQTASPNDATLGLAANTVPTPTTSVSQNTYPPAQPGASLPAPTGAATMPTSELEPTKTSRTPSVAAASYSPASPAPPQPGAAPMPFTPDRRRSSVIPPPPKAGEEVKPASYYAPQYAPSPTGAPAPPTSQTIPPLPSHQQTSTLSNPVRAQPPASTTLGGDIGSLNNPPGYAQDAQTAFADRPVEPYNPFQAVTGRQGNNSSSYPSTGILGSNASSSGYSAQTSSGFGEGKEGMAGIWDTAVSWAKTAGQKLQEGEEAVWRMVEKK